FKTLVTQYSSSNFHDFAHFKVGFLSFLIGDYPTAMEWLEYHRALTRSSYIQARALYWLVRTFEKQKQKSKVNKYKEEIARVAPLSFYSFLVQKMPTFKSSSSNNPKPQSYFNAYLLARSKAFLASGQHETAIMLLSSINLEDEPQLTAEVGKYFNV